MVSEFWLYSQFDHQVFTIFILVFIFLNLLSFLFILYIFVSLAKKFVFKFILAMQSISLLAT